MAKWHGAAFGDPTDPANPEGILMMAKAWLALGLALGMGSDAAAGEWHAGLGYADSIDGDAGFAAQVAWLTAQQHPWEFSLGAIGGRDIPGGDEDALFVAVSKQLRWRRAFVGAGLALTQVDNDVLSGHGQLLTQAGYDFGPIILSLRHLSNADTGGVNRGETFLLLEWAFNRDGQ